MMPSLLLLVFIITIQAFSVRPHSQSESQVQDNKNIFILAGQSNMAGRGGIIFLSNDTFTWDGVVPPQCHPNPSIMRLNAELNWVEAEEPLHADIDVNKTAGIGPGMPFANSILEKHPGFGVVGLVPCAIGGTSISEWQRGKLLYSQMTTRVKASLQNGGTIQALLWYQGEADTISLSDAKSYKRRLHKFFLDVRDDLQNPLLPIIQVALASGQGPYVEEIREAQLDMDLLNLRTMDARGLPLGPDNLHLTTQAQVDLGQMMADAFLQFVPTSNLNPKNSISPMHNGAPTTRLQNGASNIYRFPISMKFHKIIVCLTLLL